MKVLIYFVNAERWHGVKCYVRHICVDPESEEALSNDTVARLGGDKVISTLCGMHYVGPADRDMRKVQGLVDPNDHNFDTFTSSEWGQGYAVVSCPECEARTPVGVPVETLVPTRASEEF